MIDFAKLSKITKLEKTISKANKAYHSGDEPEISDGEYDAYKAELKRLCPDSEALKQVGAKPTSALKKVKHMTICGSLDNEFDEAKIRSWVARLSKKIAQGK